MEIRNDIETIAWQIGSMQVAIQDDRLFLLSDTPPPKNKSSINVSIPIKDIVFHAGDSSKLIKELVKLSKQDKPGILTDIAAITKAIFA